MHCSSLSVSPSKSLAFELLCAKWYDNYSLDFDVEQWTKRIKTGKKEAFRKKMPRIKSKKRKESQKREEWGLEKSVTLQFLFNLSKTVSQTERETYI